MQTGLVQTDDCETPRENRGHKASTELLGIPRSEVGQLTILLCAHA